MTKLFNAGKFVLSETGEDLTISQALDIAFLRELAETVAQATGALERFEHASALAKVEQFFWRGFTDTYLEMVKGRARSGYTAILFVIGLEFFFASIFHRLRPFVAIILH